MRPIYCLPLCRILTPTTLSKQCNTCYIDKPVDQFFSKRGDKVILPDDLFSAFHHWLESIESNALASPSRVLAILIQTLDGVRLLRANPKQIIWSVAKVVGGAKDAVTVTPLIQALILTQFGIVIQRWRTDGGTGQFLNSLIASVYRAYGMIHQPSTPHVKQQNGVMERRVQTLKNTERSMRAGAGVLDDYRSKLNQLPLLSSRTFNLHQRLMAVLPTSYFSTSNPHWKPWGCLAYVNLRKEQRTGADQPAMSPSRFKLTQTEECLIERGYPIASIVKLNLRPHGTPYHRLHDHFAC